jgi:hypothetical protein
MVDDEGTDHYPPTANSGRPYPPFSRFSPIQFVVFPIRCCLQFAHTCGGGSKGAGVLRPYSLVFLTHTDLSLSRDSIFVSSKSAEGTGQSVRVSECQSSPPRRSGAILTLPSTS